MGKYYRKKTTAVDERKHRRGLRTITIAALLLCAVGVGGVSSFATVWAEDAVVTSTVMDGNKQYIVSIPSIDVDPLLKEAGISLGDEDVVVRQENENGTTVYVRRKLAAEIHVNGTTIETTGYTGDTVGQLIENAGVTLNSLDQVTPSAATQVWADTDITVTERKNVYIVDNNVAQKYTVPVGTVKAAVKAAGIKLGKEDSVANANAQVKEGMTIRINRVTYETVKKSVAIPYDVVTKETDSLEEGTQKVQTKGISGKKVVTYRQKLVNGKVVRSTVQKEVVKKEAQDKVVLVGTKTKSAGELADGLSYSKVITGTCTAYTGDSTTSTGMTPQVGVVAVDPNIIPYGTKLYIASPDGSYVYGYAVAGDTGGAMMAGEALCDLYMNTEQECMNFGRRTMNLYVLS